MSFSEEIKTQYRELAAKKRAELEAALGAGEVGEPFSATVLGSVFWAKVLGAVWLTAAAASASGPITHALFQRKKRRKIVRH